MNTISTTQNYYSILGLNKAATAEEIKKAFRSKAKIYHPDVCKLPNAHDIFIEIGRAHEILKDPETRRDYDRVLEEEANSSSDQYKYNSSARNNFNEARKKADQQAEKYAEMTLDNLINIVLGYTYEVGRTILAGERDKPKLNFFDYIKYGFIGFILTTCIIISFTGVGTIPGAAIGLLIFRGLWKDNSFIGIGPFLLYTLIADVVAIILIIFILTKLFG